MKLSHWLPMPGHSALLLVIWVLLAGQVTVGNVLLGMLLAIGIPRLVYPLHRPQARPRRPLLAAKFLGRVLVDIVMANFEVAWRVCQPVSRLRPALVAVELELSGDLPVTLLASTISLTPGTVSAEVSDDRRWLYVHALHCEDPEALAAQIKRRYEQPLREVFAC